MSRNTSWNCYLNLNQVLLIGARGKSATCDREWSPFEPGIQEPELGPGKNYEIQPRSSRAGLDHEQNFENLWPIRTDRSVAPWFEQHLILIVTHLCTLFYRLKTGGTLGCDMKWKKCSVICFISGFDSRAALWYLLESGRKNYLKKSLFE